jgi:hypothetical protein
MCAVVRLYKLISLKCSYNPSYLRLSLHRHNQHIMLTKPIHQHHQHIMLRPPPRRAHITEAYGEGPETVAPFAPQVSQQIQTSYIVVLILSVS